jgi:drug/metabolite transporter (DMT)-like permease
VYSILTITFAALQAVSFKNIGYSLEKYPYVILLVVAFSFVPILFLLVAYVDVTYGLVKETKSSALKKKFLCLGFLNALNGILIIFSNPHVPGIAQSALAQAVIPFTLLLAVCYLGSSFSCWQVVGSFVVLLGIFMTFIPSLFYSHEQAHGTSMSPFYAIMFCLGQVPAAFSGVYQENAFSQARVNVVYMMAWSSLAQFGSLLLLAPVNFIPSFGTTTPSLFFHSLGEATSCIVNTDPIHHPECKGAGVNLLWCIVTMLLTQIFQTLLVKVSSASFVVICMTLITPVSSFCFTFPFLMGANTETLNNIQVIALLVLLLGIALYRSEGALCQPSEKDEGDERASSHHSMSESTEHFAGDAFEGSTFPTRTMTLNTPENPSDRKRTKPILMPTRCGIINSEYTAGGFRRNSIFSDWEASVFFEATEYETSQLLSNSYEAHSYTLDERAEAQKENQYFRFQDNYSSSL